MTRLSATLTPCLSPPPSGVVENTRSDWIELGTAANAASIMKGLPGEGELWLV